MSTEQFLIAHVGATLLAVVAAGLLVRRRVAFCWSFFVYVLAALTISLLIMHWPERFWVFSFYSMKETAYVVLRILIALEIWQRSFSSFPRARVRVGFLLAGALLVTAVAVEMVPDDRHPFDALIGILSPRQQAGTLALYAILVLAASWYRIPLHPLHRAILIGFAAYLTVHALLLSVVSWHTWSAWAYQRFSALDQTAYTATAVWWAWAAWRPSRAPSPILFETTAVGTYLVAVVAAFASGLVLLALLGRYREAAWLADWEEMLTPAGQQHYEELRERFAREFAASHFTYQRARAASDRGDLESAARLLEAGHEFVAALAPERERLLRGLARYTRMLGAVAPLPPLRPAQFHLRELATLAGLGWFVHHFLATVPERLRLRLGILRRGQAMVLRVLPAAGRRQPGARLGVPDWERIDAAWADWSTLDRESLNSFRALLTMLLAPAGCPAGPSARS